MKPLYCFTIFLGSLLLFAIQPMVGKMLLPSLGGTPAVWNTCVVFFQAVLLVGYGYAHFGSSRLSPRVQVIVHLILLGIVTLFLPIGLVTGFAVGSQTNPTFWLLFQLGLMVGIPFFVLSSNAPLLQRWYSLANREQGKDPYFLYAFSNAGSLIALLAYPLLLEPLFGLSQQSNLWMILFLGLALAFIGCGWWIFKTADWQPKAAINEAQKSTKPANSSSSVIRWKDRFYFVVLAAVPSSLMLGVTTYITTDVGSMPMIWVIPLALYLLTFVFAFAKKQVLPHGLILKAMPYMALLMAILLLVDLGSMPWLIAPAHLLAFFVMAMFCHGELAKRRPPVENLTEFYFLLSIGGVIGGSFNGLIAPWVFQGIAEYPLAIVIACLLIPATKYKFAWKSFPIEFVWPTAVIVFMVACAWILESIGIDNKAIAAILLFGLPALLCFSFQERRVRFALCLAAIVFGCSYYFVDRNVVVSKRGFFGVNKVLMDDKNGYALLINGRTVHGIQSLDPERATEPLSYFHRSGPIGDLFELSIESADDRVGVIGLGTGSIACYAKPNQRFDFYEIDPVVVEFAQSPQYFSFLERSLGDCQVILGDARIQIQNRTTSNVRFEAENLSSKYRLMILDAFSSDSIPTHLVTREAIELYFENLETDGYLALHITNKFIDLAPLLAALAEEVGLKSAIRSDGIRGDFVANRGKESSVYVVMVRRPEQLKPFLETGNWELLTAEKSIRVWTDEYSNLIDVLKW